MFAIDCRTHFSVAAQSQKGSGIGCNPYTTPYWNKQHPFFHMQSVVDVVLQLRGDFGPMSHFSDYSPLHVNAHIIAAYPKKSTLIPPSHRMRGTTAVLVRHKPQ